ncbi:large subunit ribosomal protein L14e [Vigna unguiculata]|uniref:Large subunit ribosomal protein L14e n=1 Tax=Vigna unguiculata TaxID=3917 RepID=A0A4D6MEU3_VIGUN|nr:large subunit ribosomal protein L14e [Vigna unguiculata]
MIFKRYIEIGRVAQINYGKDYGRLVVIVDVIGQNRVCPFRFSFFDLVFFG